MRPKIKNAPNPKATISPILVQLSQKLQQAIAFHQTGQLARAQTIYEEILTIEPEHFDALHLLGVIAGQTKDPKRAAQLIGKAIAINPNHAAAHCNRGSVLKELKQWNAALASYDRAIALRPDYAEAFSNRGTVLRQLKHLEAALASYDRAIAIKADYAEAYSNRGNVLRELRQFDAALASYNQAIAIRDDYAEAYCNRSIALLLAGDFESGWVDYEWRWKDEGCKERRSFSQPLWLGAQSLEGKTILLHSEQGMGDALQFCRYVKLVSDLQARVILEVQAPLASLLGNLEGVSQLVVRGITLPRFDYHCPLLSLPLAFKTHLDTIPASTKYLSSDATKVSHWRAKLGERTKPRVGLVWSGNAQHKHDHDRSIALAALMEHLPVGFQYVSLQKELRESDKRVFRAISGMLNVASDLNDFGDTAALCECLDLVISVDTSVAHLSGALGKETWILLPFHPDWRWLLDRDDSPWYPTAKLYRQERIGDWGGVLDRVKGDLIRTFMAS